MTKVISYIDGFNLYYGLREKGWRKYYWLDVAKVSKAILKQDQALQHCYYFTAHIRTNKHGQNRHRQTLWLDALKTRPDITCRFGQYLTKTVQCNSCKATWRQPEEKMTDVNIATQLIVDAYEGNYDTALIVSGDSDLTPPIEYIRKRFPDKKIVVAFPPRRHSKQLKKAASRYIILGEDKLRNGLLPDKITVASGHVLKRPDSWR